MGREVQGAFLLGRGRTDDDAAPRYAPPPPLSLATTRRQKANPPLRHVGIIPVLASLPAVLSAHADPTTSLINIAQTVSLLIYYPLENTSYLSSKGVIPLSPHREAAWSTWSCRFWAAYVVLDVWRLARQRGEMQRKGRAVRMRMDGGEKDVGAVVEALRREKVGWMEEVVVNVYVWRGLLCDSRLMVSVADMHRLRFTGHYPTAHGQTRRVLSLIRHAFR